MANKRIVLPVNPYIAGPPLQQKQGFFGRQDVLRQVLDSLQTAAVAKQIVLFGQRRIGKTSLLYQLQQALPKQSFLTVYYDLQDRATKPLSEVITQLSRQIALTANWPKENLVAYEDEEHFYQEFLPLLTKKIRRKRVVLLLDEFDALSDTDTVLSDRSAARAFFPFLRRLLAEAPNLNIVCAFGRQAEDVKNFEATFKGFLSIPIWVLDEPSARDLILQAQRNGTLEFTESAIVRLLKLTRGHPFITQLVCERLWHQARRTAPGQVPVVTTGDVEKVISIALEGAAQAFEWLWGGLSPAERIYVSALAEISKPDDDFSHQDIVRALTAHTQRGQHPEVEAARSYLVRRNVLEETRPQTYRFQIEFFHLWVGKYKSISIVKDELDRLNSPANKMYEAGREFFDRAQWAEAETQFREALRLNTEHSKAQLYLGLVLQKQTYLDKAIVELEYAYRLDSSQAKDSLVNILVERGDLYWQDGEDAAAATMYRRAMELEPNNKRSNAQLQKIALKQSAKLQRPEDRAARLAAQLADLLQPYLSLMTTGLEESLGADWHEKVTNR